MRRNQGVDGNPVLQHSFAESWYLVIELSAATFICKSWYYPLNNYQDAFSRSNHFFPLLLFRIFQE